MQSRLFFINFTEDGTSVATAPRGTASVAHTQFRQHEIPQVRKIRRHGESRQHGKSAVTANPRVRKIRNAIFRHPRNTYRRRIRS
ncbi:hypothetical protein ACU19_05705 [Actinobaculum suis]|nr:hypothetical protein ACU19_05705 [Actinobaculum suis]